MHTAGQMIGFKGDELATLPSSATAFDAARLMTDCHIGSVVVVDDDGLVGIFTERDLMRRVVVEGRDAQATSLEEVMTAQVAVATCDTSLDEVRNVMRSKRIRHLPVVEDGRAVGMVSLGDLNRAQHDIDVETIHYLEQYISVT
ncbi:MAG: CBS domain-containing protein [Planctomycetota bacterium]